MIRAVAFDLWETLITDTAALSKQQERLRLDRMEAILTRSGRAATASTIEHAYRALWQRCLVLYWSDDRDIPCRRQIEHFLEALDLDPASFDASTLDALEEAYGTAAVDVPPALVPFARETLLALKERRLQIGLISNTGRTPGSALRRILENHGVAQFIDAMVFSNEHGACKPRPSIFEELRSSLGTRFDEMVFVGDNLYVDVHGAQLCGMRAIHFVPPARGTAVARAVEHSAEIAADAIVTSLQEVPSLIDAFAPQDAAAR